MTTFSDSAITLVYHLITKVDTEKCMLWLRIVYDEAYNTIINIWICYLSDVGNWLTYTNSVGMNVIKHLHLSASAGNFIRICGAQLHDFMLICGRGGGGLGDRRESNPYSLIHSQVLYHWATATVDAAGNAPACW